MDYFFNIAVAYANRRFKQMDQDLERRTEAAALTTTELKARVHEAVSESVSVLLTRVEQNEQRLERMEQLLGPPRRPPLHPEEHPSMHVAALRGTEPKSDEVNMHEAVPRQERIPST